MSRFKRWDTSPNHPGKIFWAYQHGGEFWATMEQGKKWDSESNRRVIAARKLKRATDPEWVKARHEVDVARWARNRRRINEYACNRRKNNINARLAARLTTRIRAALKASGQIKCQKAEILLGCNKEYFKQHIARQFVDGLSWENMDRWHLDHVIATSLFDLSDPLAQKYAFNYRNIRPMWGLANRSKQNTLDMVLVRQHNLYDWLTYLQDSTPLSLAA